jgi:hypothetical protein
MNQLASEHTIGLPSSRRIVLRKSKVLRQLNAWSSSIPFWDIGEPSMNNATLRELLAAEFVKELPSRLVTRAVVSATAAKRCAARAAGQW